MDKDGLLVVFIASIHGHAINAIVVLYKMLELDLNCRKNLNGHALDLMLVELDYLQVLNTGVAFLDTSLDQRIWNQPDTSLKTTTLEAEANMTETKTIASLASNRYKTLQDLTTSLVTVIQLDYSYI